ncbi:fluoride efflux transporter FluC [Gordonia crocea]|uniref:Fluoride-specific ion channel FluC n=1 Tax=Gordonia crocea TaxID=589162 RepID=A0A7M3SUG2_9ACTN|nr:CrcB family protein [Gordonia crocea]GED96286.1 putative fluoride ion transporter CrcB [Gordonia crocea]
MSTWAVAACAAGGAGAVLRYAIDATVKARVRTDLPIATIAINVVGSALLGFFTGLVTFGAPGTLTLVLGTGFCGGFTTFSTASFETVALARRGEHVLALVTAAGTWIAALAACGVGFAVSWFLVGR